MIDKHGEIVVANHAYYEVFSPDQQVENKNYIGFIDDSIEKLIIESFRTEKVIYDQIEVNINNVSCVPILSKSKKKLQGMVVVLHDITNLQN